VTGWLDVTTSLRIPDDLSASLAVAEGLVGATVDEWLDYCGMFERAGRPVKLSQPNEYQGLLDQSINVIAFDLTG